MRSNVVRPGPAGPGRVASGLMSRGLSVLMIASAIAWLAGPARAAWPHDPNNGNLAICTDGSSQVFPTIASDGAGGVIIAWGDGRSGSGDIYVQRVNAAGVPQWTANGVALCSTSDSQAYPTIVSDGTGGAIVTWEDARTDGVSWDIFAQRVNSAGVPQWAANGVALCTAFNHQFLPKIVSDGAGGAIITWHDLRDGNNNSDIYTQRVNAAGVPQWTANGVPICTAAFNQDYPAIVSDGSGGAFIAWRDERSGTNWDIYAQRVNASGVPQWPANGVAICTAPDHQFPVAIALDGAGGAILTWQDPRSGDDNIYAQRVNASGVPQWTADGVALCTAVSYQVSPMIVPDGAGGAIVAWDDYRNGGPDVFAQRVNSTGVPQWAADGVALCTAPNQQSAQTMISDNVGGAIVTWEDARVDGLRLDIYAQRVNAAGAPQWTYDGVALSTAVWDQGNPTITSDGSSGAVVTWVDSRSNTSYDIYAQRIDSFGYLGSPEPSIASVRDIPNDQGGEVKVSWNASYLDAQPYHLIDSYWILRAAPPNVVAEARATGARVTADLSTEPEPGVRTFLTLPDQATGYSWEFIASQPAFHVSSYSYVTPTTSDSIAAGNPRTAFMIVANRSRAGEYWDSAPDSGYSVDNIPPAAPAPFTGAYVAGATHLHWGRNIEPDLAGYRLYRGSSSGFVPAPGNLISAQPDTGFGDVGPAGRWYKLSAVDSHGNESLYAILGPNGTLDASVFTATKLALAPPAPNPSTGEGATFCFSLPAGTRVSLVIFDEQGRRVRELVNGTLPAGQHLPRWDGRDDSGRMLPSGIYFLRLEAMGRSIRARFARLR